MNKLSGVRWPEPLWNVASEGAGGTASPSEPPVEPADAVAAETPGVKPTLLGGDGAPPSEGGDQAAEEKPAEVVAPLTAQDLTLPEGLEVPEETLTEFLSVMNDSELDPKGRAEKLLGLQQSFMTTVLEDVGKHLETSWNETIEGWEKQVQALPEIGGKALPQTLATIKKGLETVGATKETFQAFDLTGAGSNPEIVRVLFALTKHLAEGSPVSGSPTKGPLTLEQKMFGNMKQE